MPFILKIYSIDYLNIATLVFTSEYTLLTKSTFYKKTLLQFVYCKNNFFVIICKIY